MDLAATQALFWRVVTGNEVVDARVLLDCFNVPRAEAQGRLRLYRNMYAWRLGDTLRDSFPLLDNLLGDDVFTTLATAHAHARPPLHPCIAQVGSTFADFVRSQSGVRPDAADLADLEWARAQAANATAVRRGEVSLEALRAAGPAARLRVAPDVELIVCAYDVVALWEALVEDAPLPEPICSLTHIAVWRSETRVQHARLVPAVAAALVRSQRGETWAEVSRSLGHEEAALGVLMSWCESGWVVGYE